MARTWSLGRGAALLAVVGLSACEAESVPRSREEQDAAIAAAREEAAREAKAQLAAEAEAEERIEHPPDLGDAPEASEAPVGPVRLSALRVNAGRKKRRRKAWPLNVRVKAEALESLEGAAYLHVKASCAAKGQVFVDVAEFRHAKDASKSIDAFTIGKPEPLIASVFGLGRVSRALPCKLEFKLGGPRGAGLRVDLGEACWNGRRASIGPCDNPVAPAVTSGFKVPIEVTSLKRAESGEGGTRFDFTVLFHQSPPPDAHLWLKGACEFGKKVYAYTQDTALPNAAFAVEQFESVARSAWLFPPAEFGHRKPPERCDLTVWQTARSVEQPEVPAKGGAEVWVASGHHDACLRDDEIVRGRCDHKPVDRDATVALNASNVELANVALQLIPLASTETFELQIKADLTVSQRLATGNRFVARTTCSVRRKKKRDTVDLLAGSRVATLLPGETTKMGGTAFARVPIAAPGWCQVTFKALPEVDSPAGGPQLSLGTYCVKNNAVRKRKC